MVMVKFCPECGSKLVSETSKFCDKCGAALPSVSLVPPIGQTPVQKQGPTIVVPKKNRSALEWIAIICGGFILLVGVAAFIAGMSHGLSPTSSHSLSITDIKNQAQNITYDNLVRNNENYIGKTVYFRGVVSQVFPQSEDNYDLVLSTSGIFTYDGSRLYIHYKGSRFLEGDTIDVWGKVDGLTTMTSVLGAETTIPEISALHVEMVAYPSSSSSTSSIVTTGTLTPTQNGWFYDPETGSYKKA
jgi:hypothetical protein